MIRRAMAYVEPERLQPCSNCGMTPLPYETALGKISSIAAGADLGRRTLQRNNRLCRRQPSD